MSNLFSQSWRLEEEVGSQLLLDPGKPSSRKTFLGTARIVSDTFVQIFVGVLKQKTKVSFYVQDFLIKTSLGTSKVGLFCALMPWWGIIVQQLKNKKFRA